MSNTPNPARSRHRANSRSHGGASAMALLLLLPLGACGVNRTIAPPVSAYDYRDRHPVTIADADQSIDLFPSPSGARLDTTTAGRVREFASRYRRFGHGQISILVPVGGRNESGARLGIDEIRRALYDAGVDGGVYVGSYPVADPTLAAPIRMTFRGLKAKVMNRCGDWPDDLASGTSLEGWRNQSYWNFGCATQSTLSAQIDDPRDLVTPRGEAPGDIEMRMRAIGKVRQGEDPTTKWTQKALGISSVGGGGN